MVAGILHRPAGNIWTIFSANRVLALVISFLRAEAMSLQKLLKPLPTAVPQGPLPQYDLIDHSLAVLGKRCDYGDETAQHMKEK